jgi:hypothetical protein
MDNDEDNDNIFGDGNDDDMLIDNINTADYDDIDDDDNNNNNDDDNEQKEGGPAKKKGGGGFTKPVQLSTELSEFVGGNIIIIVIHFYHHYH